MESSDEKLLSELATTTKISHRKYTVDFKLKVLKLVHSNFSLHEISNKLNIDRKVLRDWMDKESSLLKVKNKDIKYRCDKTTGFIKVFTDEEEDLIYQLIIAQREKLLPVSNKSLISYAGSINKEFSEKMINTQLNGLIDFCIDLAFL